MSRMPLYGIENSRNTKTSWQSTQFRYFGPSTNSPLQLPHSVDDLIGPHDIKAILLRQDRHEMASTADRPGPLAPFVCRSAEGKIAFTGRKHIT